MIDRAKEPPMEDILASIQRIMSRDGKYRESVSDAAAAEPAVAPGNQPAEIGMVEEGGAGPDSDATVRLLETRTLAETGEPAPVDPASQSGTLVSPARAGEAIEAISRLTDELDKISATPPQDMLAGTDAITLEQMARDLMRPMLKQWLDQHLPAIVERRVCDEIRRLVTLAGNRGSS